MGKTLIPDQINHLNSHGASFLFYSMEKYSIKSNKLILFSSLSSLKKILGKKKSNSGVKNLRAPFFLTHDGSMHLNRPNLRDLGLDFFLKRKKTYSSQLTELPLTVRY